LYNAESRSALVPASPRCPGTPILRSGIARYHHCHAVGLDDSNSNAASRAIVVHGAWYVIEEIAKELRVLRRSEGCFAVANQVSAKFPRRSAPVG
jgi:hypothetical protein